MTYVPHCQNSVVRASAAVSMKQSNLFGEVISKRKQFTYTNPKEKYQKLVEAFFSRNVSQRSHQTKEDLLKEG